MARILLTLSLLLVPALAAAQSARDFPTLNLGERVPGSVNMCLDASGRAVPATVGGICAGSGGAASTVNQGAAGTVPWLVSWTGQSVAVSNATLAVTQSGAWTVGLAAGSNAIGSVSVSNFPVTQPVSASALPLPSGAATAANQNVTAAGTSAANAQAVQGVTNGVPMQAGLASGADVTAGATTDAPLTAPATSAASSVNAALKGTFNLLQGGTARLQTATWWIEVNGTSVAASATTAGTSRSSGSVAGGAAPFSYFQVQLYSTQAGTLTITDLSYAAGNGVVSSTAVAAGSYTIVKVPALGGFFQASFINGTTAGTINMTDGFTAS